MNGQYFSLIIFDCDGVLVDSEVITSRVFAAMLDELGIQVTVDEIFENFVGKSTVQCLEIIAGLLGGPPPVDFIEQYHKRTSVALRSELKAVEGVEIALDSLDVPYCVASNGTHEKMRTTLGITGLLPRFEGKIFAVTDVAQGKPAPDIFLYAAGKMGASPTSCAVIEDTPTGVIAAVAAGMRVYGYCAHTPSRMLIAAGAHVTFGRMADLPEVLKAG
jgi:HAD superfamily hydrolase (TIGR01509 family)